MQTKYGGLINKLNFLLEAYNDKNLSKEEFERICNRFIKIAHDKFVIDTIEEKLLIEQARGIILGIEKEFTEPTL